MIDASAEARVRAAVAAGRAPAGDDVLAVLTALDRARAESEERWQAIGRLAPAAKRNRGRAEAQARAIEVMHVQLGQHLDRLDRMLDRGPGGEPLRAWAAEARARLAEAIGSGSSGTISPPTHE